MTVLEDIAELRMCAWRTASCAPAQVERSRAAADAHADASIIASCQRIEVLHRAECGCDASYRWVGIEALARLAGIAAGIHSLVIGEPEILGQVRAGLSGAPASIARAGEIAIAAARELRVDMGGADSGLLADLALELGGAAPRGHAVVVGAGHVAGLVASRCLSLGFDRLTVVSRRQPEAGWFDEARMQWTPFGDLAATGPAEVLFSCLGPAAPRLSHQALPGAIGLIVDLGTPRTVDAVPGVECVTLGMMVDHDMTLPAVGRRRELLSSRLREILLRRLEQASVDADTPVGRLRLEVERVRRAEVERIRRLHPQLEPATVETITRGLVNQLFHLPTQRLREIDDPSVGERLVALFQQHAISGEEAAR